jgi:hypothetical protein
LPALDNKIIEALERVLATAKAGDLELLVVIARHHTPAGIVATHFAYGDSTSMAGALAIMYQEATDRAHKGFFPPKEP